MYCLETSNLRHRFSDDQVVLHDINLQVPHNSIYGFLGPNGAGKTTTLKLILGLLKKQEGDITVFGKHIGQHRLEILRQTGSLIESPSLYGHLTAVENLQVLQKIYQCPAQRIPEVLHLVGLESARKKKASQFSLGMRQRLSIAIALLHNPPLLILDEPTNGLDPNGIIDIRELLRKLNQNDGITILLSSHLLSEIERLVTHVGIIDKGKMMFQGTLEALTGRQQQVVSVVLETSDIEKTLAILAANNLSGAIRNGKIEIAPIPKDQIASIAQQLVRNDIGIYEITGTRNDLEMIFIDLINN